MGVINWLCRRLLSGLLERAISSSHPERNS
nr:MAG TPA: hypothetical protein [Caudoviricetes sp.]